MHPMAFTGCGPQPVTVTTRITFLVGDSNKPSCTTVTGRGPHPRDSYICFFAFRFEAGPNWMGFLIYWFLPDGSDDKNDNVFVELHF